MKPFKEERLKGLDCDIGEALEGFPWKLEAGMNGNGYGGYWGMLQLSEPRF